MSLRIPMLLALAATLAGCSNDKAPTRVVAGPPFVADSPIHLLRLLEWSFNNRSESEYRTLFSEDYRFVFSAHDSSGNAYRAVPWTREDETISARTLFLGGGPTQPPATSVMLIFEENPVVTADVRDDGITRDPRLHKSIRTRVLLNIRLADGSAFDVTGSALFCMSRGDSAQAPDGLPADSSHWYLTRWEDETAHAGRRITGQSLVASPEDSQPSRSYTFGYIKALYR